MIQLKMNLYIILSLLILIHIVFYVSIKEKKFSLIDVAWPVGFIITSTLSKTIAIYFVLIWAIRLLLYLGYRYKNSTEDSRYTKLRYKWKEKANINAYKFIFLFQGWLMYLLSFPIIFGKNLDSTFSTINYLGMFLFAAGFFLECYSDFYLLKFKKQKSGKICMSGPWKFCRFPNYLGEIILWYGIYLITFSTNNWWCIFAPILLNILIINLTGIAPIEEKYKMIHEYQKYSKHTRRLLFIKSL